MTTPQQYQAPMPMIKRPSGGLTALGILTIIYAVMFQICGSIIGLSLLLWAPALAHFLENRIPDSPNIGAIFEGPFMAYTVLSSLVSLILGLSFLFSGIGLLKLRPWARSLALGASVATIVWNIMNTLIGIFIVAPMANRAMGQDYPHAPQVVGQAIGSFGGMLFHLALPIALIVFLTRPSFKEEFAPPPGQAGWA